jgi:hypothetical protein
LKGADPLPRVALAAGGGFVQFENFPTPKIPAKNQQSSPSHSKPWQEH